MIYADDSELNFCTRRVMDMVNAIRLICEEMNVAPSEKNMRILQLWIRLVVDLKGNNVC